MCYSPFGNGVQSMTEAVFSTLGPSQSSHLKKLGLWPKAEAEAKGTKYPSAALIVKLSASNRTP